MSDAVITINAGSSSLRFAAFEASAGGDPGLPRPLVRARLDGPNDRPTFVPVHGAGGAPAFDTSAVHDHDSALAAALDWLRAHPAVGRVVAVGHRIVHGGLRETAAVVDEALLAELETLVPLAPLHQPAGLAAVRAAARQLAGAVQVACFDTAFHHTLPEVARRFALPADAGGTTLRRFGFHGLSYAYVAQALPGLLPHARRVVVAHLGSGASLCALHDGRSVDTTMGMTPLDGLPMGTRCGALDPGVLLHLLRDGGHDVATLETLLYRRSGLLGLSGISADLRTLRASADPRAHEAIGHFVHHTAKAVAAMAVSLGGLDALVFTGGIGEHAPDVRAGVVERCAWLGLRLDPGRNAQGDGIVSAADAAVAVAVVPTDEERVIGALTLGCMRH